MNLSELTKLQEPWAQAGIAGLVLFGMFLLVVLVMWLGSRERQSIRDEHKEERKEWRHSAESNSDKLEAAINKLSDALSRGGD